MRTKFLATLLFVPLCSISSIVLAKGCLKGAAVGGVAGHVAGKHGAVGAAAGCAIGHHRATKKAKQEQAAQVNTTQPPATTAPASNQTVQAPPASK